MQNQLNMKILVATHKLYQMPSDQQLYTPIFVGKALHPDVHLPYIGDDTGDNISLLNPYYSELTAMYWAAKNLSTLDAVGLVHYRRYLTLKRPRGDKFEAILSREAVQDLLQAHDIILPKRRNYYIETNYSHYEHAHYATGLDLAGEIVARDYPAYLTAFDRQMQKRSAHMFNMFVMKQPQFQAYSGWLFDILHKIDQQLDISQYSAYEQRVYGFISELLLDVWLETTQQNFVEVPFLFMESQNWVKKGGAFLLRKLGPSEQSRQSHGELN